MSNPRTRTRHATSELCEGRQVPAATLEEIGELDEEHGDLRDGDTWGPWTWDADYGTLDYTGGSYARLPYSVPVRRQILEADDPGAEAWHWVKHLGKKQSWGGETWSPSHLGHFLRALLEVMRQGGYNANS